MSFFDVMKNKWSLFIDIEGFSSMYRKGEEEKALKLLSDLMCDSYRIGKIRSDDSNRLFIYQFGDGFLFCPDFEESDLERPISIAIALMQLTILKDGFVRVAISCGEMADILGCYHKEIRDNVKDGNIGLGAGIMTINQVMGTALINAHKLSKDGPKGPLLLLDSELDAQVKQVENIKVYKCDNHILIDWIHSEVASVDKIFEKIGLGVPSSETLEEKVKTYTDELPDKLKAWKKNAEILIRGGKLCPNMNIC